MGNTTNKGENYILTQFYCFNYIDNFFFLSQLGLPLSRQTVWMSYWQVKLINWLLRLLWHASASYYCRCHSLQLSIAASATSANLQMTWNASCGCQLESRRLAKSLSIFGWWWRLIVWLTGLKLGWRCFSTEICQFGYSML